MRKLYEFIEGLCLSHFQKKIRKKLGFSVSKMFYI
jgi:hypothetical protein